MATATSSHAQETASVVAIFNIGEYYYLSHSPVTLSIQLNWHYDEFENYVVDAIDLFATDGTHAHKGYISQLNAETKDICYVLNTAPRRMESWKFKHDDESKGLLDEIARSSFGI